MAEDNGQGAMPFLAFLVGGLIVAVVVVGFFAYTGHDGHTNVAPSHLSLNAKTPSHRR
jgi:hypothetical protein